MRERLIRLIEDASKKAMEEEKELRGHERELKSEYGETEVQRVR